MLPQKGRTIVSGRLRRIWPRNFQVPVLSILEVLHYTYLRTARDAKRPKNWSSVHGIRWRFNNTCGNPVKRYSITCFSLFFPISIPVLVFEKAFVSRLQPWCRLSDQFQVPYFTEFTDPTGVATAKRHIETTAVGCDCRDAPWKRPAEPMILEATYVTYGYIMIYIYMHT